MIHTIVIGNTTTRFAWFVGRRLVKSRSMLTAALRCDELPAPGRAAGVAIASVVPDMTRIVRDHVRAAVQMEAFVLGPRARTGLKFHYRRLDIGADRVGAAVGAHRRFPGQDVIVFDFGTAATANVILAEGIFAGGVILPGIQMSLDALADYTAGLPKLSPERLRDPLQRNTRGAIRAGVANLFAGGIDRIVSEVERNTGRTFRVIATGGGARTARRYSGRIAAVYPQLASEGLAEIFRINRRPSDDVGARGRPQARGHDTR